MLRMERKWNYSTQVKPQKARKAWKTKIGTKNKGSKKKQ